MRDCWHSVGLLGLFNTLQLWMSTELPSEEGCYYLESRYHLLHMICLPQLYAVCDRNIPFKILIFTLKMITFPHFFSILFTSWSYPPSVSSYFWNVWHFLTSCSQRFSWAIWWGILHIGKTSALIFWSSELYVPVKHWYLSAGL